MTKELMLAMIDEHKNNLLHPVTMLNWIWLRVFILSITDDEFETIMGRTQEVLSR